MKYGVIKQFLKDADWGQLDYLVIDCPPGTGDEPLSIAQLITGAKDAVIVTTPQDLSILDVKKSIEFCRKLNVRIAGVIENMSGFTCPKCGEQIDIFKKGGGAKMAAEMNVRYLGAVPIDVEIVKASDGGTIDEYVRLASPSQEAFRKIVAGLTGDNPVLLAEEKGEIVKGEKTMKIALPVYEGKLCMHFGHSEAFEVFEVDDHAIIGKSSLTPPAHAPGVIPQFLKENGVDVIIAGGMGSRAQGFFEEFGIRVVVGASSISPQEVVKQYLEGSLQTGNNVCDH